MRIGLILVGICLGVGGVWGEKVADHTAAGRAFAERMGRGDFTGVSLFGPALASKLDAAQLEAGWKQVVTPFGGYQGIESARSRREGDSEIVTVEIRLAKGLVDLTLRYDSAGAIAGIHLGQPRGAWDPPPYVDASKIASRDVSVGSGPKALPGTLVTPVGKGPFPVLLLVHGSGPQDRDEALGGARPFRDLAEGLASRGIAVLRWEKRTHGHIAALAMPPTDLTIKEEYLDDVGAAVAFARATPGLDPRRVFVLGHSQGGWLVPWFLREQKDVAGAVVLAGNARHFAEILPQQVEYLATLDDGKVGPLERMQIDKFRQQGALAVSPALTAATPAGDLPLGIPARYWLSLRGYDAAAVAAELPQPLLFLQGGRDYQVTEKEDLARWRTGLAARKDVTFRVYPALNHAFITGKGMATPAEYQTLSGHVDAQVIGDIASWITDRRK